MVDASLHAGDRISATVTKSVPFGALVETADGVPGLVPASRAQPGQTLTLQVDAVDEAEHRFSAIEV